MLRLAAVAGIATSAACSFQVSAAGDAGPVLDTVDAPAPADAGPGEDADLPPDASLAWSEPVPVTLATTGVDDPTLTADMLELYFNANDNIYVTTRASVTSAWGTPAVVTQLSSASTESTPEVSSDGLAMIFCSNRAGANSGSMDLFASTRTSRATAWTAPVILTPLNTNTSEAAGVTSEDRLAIAFSSYRKSNSSPDVYLSTRANIAAAWGEPFEATALNTSGHEGSVFLSGDKLTVCFDSDRAGNMDIYCAQRATSTAAFDAPEPLPAPINTNAGEEDPWFSPDGRHLYFWSNRGGTAGLWRSELQ